MGELKISEAQHILFLKIRLITGISPKSPYEGTFNSKMYDLNNIEVQIAQYRHFDSAQCDGGVSQGYTMIYELIRG